MKKDECNDGPGLTPMTRRNGRKRLIDKAAFKKESVMTGTEIALAAVFLTGTFRHATKFIGQVMRPDGSIVASPILSEPSNYRSLDA